MGWGFPIARFLRCFLVSKQVRHVFVVDDESLITESLTLILSREGFQVSSFTNPLDAIEQMKTAPPDLLISDVMMPQLSGVELAIEISRCHPDCKILLFSGQAFTKDWLAKARRDGHNFRILLKPIHPSELLREIEQIDGLSSLP
jgi:DNA-binding NtrC family response regulator